jgi:hypothetical protein
VTQSEEDVMAAHQPETWDVFIAHAGADTGPAKELAAALAEENLGSFLDAAQLRPGGSWPNELKAALARSRVIAVLVSRHSDKAYYLQEEVAIAVAISRKPSSSLRIVPIMLRGADQMHLPYGTFTRHAFYEEHGGWSAVAGALATLLKELPPPQRSGAISRSSGLVDEIWAGLGPALSDEASRLAEEFGLRYQSDGQDLVARYRDGGEVQRVTREQLEEKITPELLHHIQVLERAMEINKAIWDERYPRRVLERGSKQAAEKAARAMAEDLGGVLKTLEQAGMWLDDHYLEVRRIVEETAARR